MNQVQKKLIFDTFCILITVGVTLYLVFIYPNTFTTLFIIGSTSMLILAFILEFWKLGKFPSSEVKSA